MQCITLCPVLVPSMARAAAQLSAGARLQLGLEVAAASRMVRRKGQLTQCGPVAPAPAYPWYL